MKRCLKSSIIGEMQIKTSPPVGQLLSKKQKTSASECVEQSEPLCTIGWNVKWCGSWKNSVELPQKINVELPYDAAMPLLGIYSNN